MTPAEAYAAVPLDTFVGRKSYLVDIVAESRGHCLLHAGDHAGAAVEFERLLDRIEKDTGRSNAIAIADRLGMPPAVLDRARSAAAPSEASIEDLLETLQRERDTLTDARRAEEHARAEAEEIREPLGRRLVRAKALGARLVARF